MKLKRWIAVVLCCVLVLACAACGAEQDSSGQGPGGTAGAGRYVETDITPPGAEGENLTSFLAGDGSLLCYTQDLKRMFTSVDGGDSWTESAGPGAVADLPGTVQNLALLADGSLLAALEDASGYSLAGLVKIKPDGTVEPFSVPPLEEAIASGKTTYINQLQVLSADRLFLGFVSGDFGVMAGGNDEAEDTSLPPGGDEGGVADPSEDNAPESAPEDEDGGMFFAGQQTNFSGLIDLDSGAVVAEYAEWFGVGAVADEDTLYLLGHDGEVEAKALADGATKTAGEGKLPMEAFSFNLAVANGKDGMYVMDGKRIQRLKAGEDAETVMDGSGYSFADPGLMAAGMHVLENGDMVLNLLNGNSTTLYRYSWDENATLDPSQVLKVWSLYDNYLVRAAISQLRRQNPDAVVEYEVALADGEGGVTAEDAIKTLNTRLLNGDGPDVMILDGCPADSYAARGMLQNLADMVDTGDMFQNLAAPFTTDEGMFYLPMNVKIPLLLGTGGNLSKADTLQALAEMVAAGNGVRQLGDTEDVFATIPEEERPVLALDDLEEIFNLLWNSSAGAVVTGEGLDSAALRELLDALLRMSDKYELGSGGGIPSGAMAMMSTGGAAATVTGSPLAYASQRAVLGGYTADDMQMLQMMIGPPNSEIVSFPGLTEGSFVPASMVGVNADSEKMELAAQFVNTMLGEEVQGTRSGSGFPVTEAGIKKQIADINDIMRENQDASFEFDYTPLVALAKTPMLADDVVKGMVWEVAQSLCEGKTDLEGAVKQLEQNLKNYLAERQ